MPALADSVREAVAFAKSTDDFKPKLQILKESPSYQAGNAPDAVFVYAMPSDSVLAADRAFFNLDSIAGEGTDVEKMKRLTYWVHDLVPHDGGSYNPEPRNLRHLAEVCKEEGRGVNCRMMAIMLTEALLAEGIPARYLTCQPKAWDTDSDCRVICVGWSESLGKWIWLDPTFAAFVSDENGTPSIRARCATACAATRRSRQRGCQLEPQVPSDQRKVSRQLYGQEPLFHIGQFDQSGRA